MFNNFENVISLNRKSDIKFWCIENISIRSFFEKYYDMDIINEMQLSSQISVKHLIIRDMIWDIRNFGYTVIGKSRSCILEAVGFKPRIKIN